MKLKSREVENPWSTQNVQEKQHNFESESSETFDQKSVDNWNYLPDEDAYGGSEYPEPVQAKNVVTVEDILDGYAKGTGKKKTKASTKKSKTDTRKRRASSKQKAPSKQKGLDQSGHGQMGMGLDFQKAEPETKPSILLRVVLVLILLLIIWLLVGTLMNLGILPWFDLGYSWLSSIMGVS